jgi:hypothetical protein
MTTEQKIARRKLRLLELASDLGNVSKACKGRRRLESLKRRDRL